MGEALKSKALLAALFAAVGLVALAQDRLLNVSYDPTRELYKEANAAFAKRWKAETGRNLTVNMSHGGSGKQARAVLDGLEADVISLALPLDVDLLAAQGLLSKGWREQFPSNSSPYTSTIVFLVRKGNPKKIQGWDDLVKSDVQVITPNPKTSGAARYAYLAAWGQALQRPGGTAAQGQAFVAALFRNVPVMDTGARGATTTFVERKIGDCLLSWENEAMLALTLEGAEVEIVRPEVSIVAEPPVAVVAAVAKRHGTDALAKGYVEFLFSPEGQEIAARHHYRPRSEEALKRHAVKFPSMKLFTVEALFASWAEAQKEHFADGGSFDRLFETAR